MRPLRTPGARVVGSTCTGLPVPRRPGARVVVGVAVRPAATWQTARVISQWPEPLRPLADRIAPGQAADPRALWVALALVVLVMVWPTARRWGRTLVTVVHEAGHAAVGLMVGRKFLGFVVKQDLSGHAVTAGPTRGPGRVATTWAGYPAPAVGGALLVAAGLGGWAGIVLLLALVALLILLVMSRSLRTGALMIALLVLTAALWWWGHSWRGGAVAGIGLALLVGAWDSLGDVARSRGGGQDHRTLAELTRVPSGVWLLTWFVADALATVAAGWILWGQWLQTDGWTHLPW